MASLHSFGKHLNNRKKDNLKYDMGFPIHHRGFTSVREVGINHIHVLIIGPALHVSKSLKCVAVRALQMSLSPKYVTVSCFDNEVIHIR